MPKNPTIADLLTNPGSTAFPQPTIKKKSPAITEVESTTPTVPPLSHPVVDRTQVALWLLVALSITVTVVTLFTRPVPTYTAVPSPKHHGIFIIDATTGEAIKFCTLRRCIAMPQEVDPPRFPTQ